MKFYWPTLATATFTIWMIPTLAFCCDKSFEELDQIRLALTGKLQVSTFSPKTPGAEKTVRTFAIVSSYYGRVLCPSVTAVIADDSHFLPLIVENAVGLASRGVVKSFNIWKFVFPESQKKEEAWALLEMGIQGKKDRQWTLIRYDEQQATFVATEDPEEIRKVREVMSGLKTLRR